MDGPIDPPTMSDGELIQWQEAEIERLLARLHDIEANGDYGETVQRNAALEENRRTMETDLERRLAEIAGLRNDRKTLEEEFALAKKVTLRMLGETAQERDRAETEIERLQTQLQRGVAFARERVELRTEVKRLQEDRGKLADWIGVNTAAYRIGGPDVCEILERVKAERRATVEKC